MDSKVYGTTLNKKKVSSVIDEKLLSLSDIMHHPHPYQNRHIIAAYCNDLEQILHIEDITELSQRLLDISYQLDELSKDRGDTSDEVFPQMQKFYLKLSPVLLQMFSQEVEDYHQSIIETIRISLEDELFFWKEHLMGL